MSGFNLHQELNEQAREIKGLLKQATVTQLRMQGLFERTQLVVSGSGGQFISPKRDADRLGRLMLCLALCVKNLEAARGILQMAEPLISELED